MYFINEDEADKFIRKISEISQVVDNPNSKIVNFLTSTSIPLLQLSKIKLNEELAKYIFSTKNKLAIEKILEVSKKYPKSNFVSYFCLFNNWFNIFKNIKEKSLKKLTFPISTLFVIFVNFFGQNLIDESNKKNFIIESEIENNSSNEIKNILLMFFENINDILSRREIQKLSENSNINIENFRLSILKILEINNLKICNDDFKVNEENKKSKSTKEIKDKKYDDDDDEYYYEEEEEDYECTNFKDIIIENKNLFLQTIKLIDIQNLSLDNLIFLSNSKYPVQFSENQLKNININLLDLSTENLDKLLENNKEKKNNFNTECFEQIFSLPESDKNYEKKLTLFRYGYLLNEFSSDDINKLKNIHLGKKSIYNGKNIFAEAIKNNLNNLSDEQIRAIGVSNLKDNIFLCVLKRLSVFFKKDTNGEISFYDDNSKKEIKKINFPDNFDNKIKNKF